MLLLAWCTNEAGGVRSHGRSRGVLGLRRKNILACNLMCQPESQFWVPVRLPVQQGTGESSSVDNLWVQYCDCGCDLTVYPYSHVQYGFVHFHCHDPNKIHKYDQGLPPLHAIGRNNKRIKCFRWSWQCLTCLSLLIVSHRAAPVTLTRWVKRER